MEYSNFTKRGNLEQGMADSELTLEGVVESGAQEHLYLEPCSVLVVPKKEEKEIEMFTGTQDPAAIQVKRSGEYRYVKGHKIMSKVTKYVYDAKFRKPVEIRLSTDPCYLWLVVRGDKTGRSL